MASLARELASLKSQNHGWLGADFDSTATTRTRKRKPPEPIITATTTSSHGKCRIAKSPQNSLLFADDDSVSEELTPTASPKRMRPVTSQRDKIELRKVLAKGCDDVDDPVDPDYIAFLKLVTGLSGGDLEDNVDCIGGDGSSYGGLEENADCIAGGGSDGGLEENGGGFESSVEEEIVDPDYKIFLENAREDGNSYVLEMKKSDGTRVILKYEGEDNDMDQEVEESSEEDVEVDEDVEIDEGSDDVDSDDDISNQENEEGCATEMDTGFEKRDQGMERNPSNIPGEAYWFLSKCKPETVSRADESYLEFLNHVWVKGDSLIYRNGNVTVKYGDDNGVVIDSEEAGEKVVSDGKKMEFIPVKDIKTEEMTTSKDDSDSEDSGSVEILDERTVKCDYKAKFASQLKKVLQKPFDKKELKVRWKYSKIRKPTEELRETRRCSKLYPTEKLGQSYLDLHEDLGKMLKHAVPERALALLRCLFFYYENVSHQGSFVPWIKPPIWLHDMICPRPHKSKCPLKCRSAHQRS